MSNIIKQNKLGVTLIGIGCILLILVLTRMTNIPVTYTILGIGLVLGFVLYIKTMYRLMKQIKSIIKDKTKNS